MGTPDTSARSTLFVAPAAVAPQLRRLVLAGLAGLLPTAGQAFAIAPGTFVAALGGIYNAVGDAIGPELVLQSPTTAQAGTVGSLPAAQGSFHASFGSAGFDMQSSGGVDREVDGGTAWADGWLVTGASGAGQLTIRSSIHGNISGQAESVYAVYASSQPFDFTTVIDAVSAAHGFWQIAIPNATRLQFTGVATGCGASGAFRECGHVPFQDTPGSFATTLTSTIGFTEGQPLYLVSLFAGGVSVNGGAASFSAEFALSAPDGASVTALSGTPYPAAVPEPAAWLLLVAGAALLGLQRGRSPMARR